MHVKIWYLEALAKEIHNARLRVEALAYQVYPSEALSRFVRGELLDTIKCMWTIVRRQLVAFEQQADARLSAECAWVISFWSSGYIQSVIASVSEADIHSHPLEMMLFIRELAHQLVPGERVEVVTVPMEELNFSFRQIWPPRGTVRERNSSSSSQPTVKYVELTYPRGEKDNILRSTLFAHELGHYVDQALGLTGKLLPAAYAAVISRVSAVRAAADVSHGIPDPWLSELIVGGILTSWLREAIADCFAIRVLGPAYYFCFAEIVGLLGGTVAEARVAIQDPRVGSHPRRSLRIQYQHSLMNDLATHLPQETREALSDILDMFLTRSHVVSHTTVISNEHGSVQLTSAAYDLLEKVWQSLLPRVTDVVDDVVRDELRFSPADYQLAVALVKDRLEWLIPPNEHNGEPVKPGVIINAGWYARQFSLGTIKSRMASLPEGLEGTHDAVDMLNGLLKYALYAAYVHERWERR